VDWGLWWFYVTTCVVADLTPGPAVMLVLSNAARYGPRRTVATISGLLLANIFYFAISATSLGALFLSSYELFSLVRWVGAGYLVYLGIRALWSRGLAQRVATDRGPADRSARRLFADGLLLQISNPKALLWFGAIVPQFIDAGQEIAPQVLVLGATGVLTELPTLLGYAYLAGRAATLPPRYATWTNRAAGVCLLGAGGGLAMMRRS
jgi:homoserine/homoserine lactone efflux protein